VVLPPPLPRTGGRPDGGIALLATALLVGGIGLLGTLRRGA
jgi:LPXTG-motif cell wall-anchored protein